MAASANAADAPKESRASDSLVATVAGATSYYADTFDVAVFTPTVAAEVGDARETWRAKGQYLADVVSGASVDVITSASHASPGSVHWDEVRHAGSLEGWYQPHRVGVGARAIGSTEPDCWSVTGGAELSWEFSPDRSTLGMSYSRGHRVIGRRGTPFSVFSRAVDEDRFGVQAAFRLDEAAKLAVHADVAFERGDRASPYYHIPLFDDTTAAEIPRGVPVDLIERAALGFMSERLPSSRTRFLLGGAFDDRFRAGTLHIGEWLYADTWSQYASTTDADFRWAISTRWTLGPDLRLEGQSGVDFWHRAYAAQGTMTVPAYRTTDRRFGPAITAGGGAVAALGVGPDLRPSAWTLVARADVMQSAYLDYLYATSRTAGFGSLELFAAFE